MNLMKSGYQLSYHKNKTGPDNWRATRTGIGWYVPFYLFFT